MHNNKSNGCIVTKAKYSVLISLYSKESDRCLDESLNSIFLQTLPPDQIVLICDGPIGEELEKVIEFYREKYPTILEVYRLKENKGLGNALNFGLKKTKNEYVARMDADDVSVSNRCEIQLSFLASGYDIVGSNIAEFIDKIENTIGFRNVPENHDEIKLYLKKRNPFNHPSVMFKKSKVLAVGSYKSNFRLEDYYLWIDMLKFGCKGYNVQEPLLFMRVTPDMYKRRSGTALVKSLYNLRIYMLKLGMIKKMEFLSIIIIQTTLALLPNKLRGIIYRFLLRTNTILK